MTYYDNGTFKAAWNVTNDFVTSVGYDYDTSVKYQDMQYDCYFRHTKTGSAGGYNYIGIHGWTLEPIVEFFIVDDWYTKPGTNLLGQRKGALPDEVLEVHISEEEYVHFEVIGRASEAEVIRTKSNLKRFGQEIKDVVDEEEDTPEEDPKITEAREMKTFLETHTPEETAQHFNCSRQTVVNRMKLLVERNEG